MGSSSNPHPNFHKFYVVFKGRKPGIYASWIDCHSQVHKFKGTVYQSYPTLEAAEAAWLTASTPGESYSQQACYHNVDAPSSSTIEYVEDMGRNDFILQLSMQMLLQQACNVLRIGNPTYTRQEVMFHNGQAYYRFYASLNTDLIGHPLVSMGRHAPTEDIAREDVALLLLRRLTAGVGCNIGDFNFHTISLYESQISRLEASNFDLIMENAVLKQELRALKRNLNL